MNDFPYQPLHDEVVFELPELKTKLELSEKIKQDLYNDQQIFTVLAVGPKVQTVTPGQKVMLRMRTTYPIIKLEGKSYGSVNEYGLLGIITRDLKTADNV
jgi:hypothetical protein